MNSSKYPNYKELVEAHRKIRNDPSHPDHDKPTELEVLTENVRGIKKKFEDECINDIYKKKERLERDIEGRSDRKVARVIIEDEKIEQSLEFPKDAIDFNCPDSDKIEEIVESIDNIQNHIDLDISKATISLIEERKRYESINYPYSLDDDTKDFKFWSDSIVILTGPWDFQIILMQRIYQRILDSDFTIALSNCDFERCGFIILTAFLEGTFLKITLVGMEEAIKFISKIIQLLANKIGEYADRDIGNYFEIKNQNNNTKIISAVLAILVSITCLGNKNRDSNNDNVKFAGVIFTALVSMCFSWVISIPINALTGKVIEIWNDLKSENRSVLWKSMVVTRVLFQEFPLISAFTNWVLPKLPPPDTPNYPFIKKVDDIFKCPITKELLLDPVTLHGFVFERYAITEWLKKDKSHPFTRKYASTNHIAEPPTEYTESFENYINRLIAQII